MPLFNFLASEALHIGCILNIKKTLRILHQLSKLFLNFGQGRKSVKTLPHLLQITYLFKSKHKIGPYYIYYLICSIRLAKIVVVQQLCYLMIILYLFSDQRPFKKYPWLVSIQAVMKICPNQEHCAKGELVKNNVKRHGLRAHDR